MSTRKHLRNIARGQMERDGVSHINRYLGANWRNITHAYPGFRGEKRQKRGSQQRILIYRMATSKAAVRK